MRGATAALPRPGPERRGTSDGGGPFEPLRLLPQALPVRGRAAPVRQAGSHRRDAAGPEGEARRPADAAALAAADPGWPRDHDEAMGGGPARQRPPRDAELFRQPRPVGLAAWLEEDRRLPVVEAVRLGHPLDLVAEGADLARQRARVVDVSAAVQDVDVQLPRRWQRFRSVLFRVAAEA